jgi:hypothetical protein
MEVQAAIANHLASLASSCEQMGSHFFGGVLRRAVAAYEADPIFRYLLERHAHRSYVGLRLGGAAHFRALSGAAPEIARHYPSTGGDGDVERAWSAVLRDIHGQLQEYDSLLERPVQTNEVARAMPVLGAMLAFAAYARKPLRVYEVGSSAGLLLNFDRYHYTGEGWSWGDERSPVHLQNVTLSGKPAHLDARLTVIERRGCDLNALDAVRDAQTLLGFVWPDQPERLQRLSAAIDLAREHPLDIVTADGITWARETAKPQSENATVLLHTVTADHMDEEELQRLEDAIVGLAQQASADAPFAWIRMEGGGPYETRLTYWPNGQEVLVARSDGHAQNIRWSNGALGESSC